MTHEDPTAAEPTAYAADYPIEDYPATGAAPLADGRRGRVRWILSLAALLAAAAAFVAAGAHGIHVLTATAPAPATVTLPPPDQNAAFLADLQNAGLLAPRSPNQAITLAHFVCASLGMGKTETDLTSTEFTQPWGRISLPFAKLAEQHYCPSGHM